MKNNGETFRYSRLSRGIGLSVVIVSEEREPADLHATRPGPEHGVRFVRGCVAALLQGRAPVDLLRPALSLAPVVVVEPCDPVQDVW